jgi:hypothetical protein
MASDNPMVQAWGKESKMPQEDQDITQPTPGPTEQRERIWRIPEGGSSGKYSNFFYFHWGPVDVRLRFGLIIPNPSHPPSKAEWEVEEVAAIVMSWDQAKFLRDAFTDAVRRYEEANGEITPKKLPK